MFGGLVLVSIVLLAHGGYRLFYSDGPFVRAYISYPEAIVIEFEDNLWILDGQKGASAPDPGLRLQLY